MNDNASIAAALARIEARQEGFDERLSEVREDAREARDVAKGLAATIAEHNMPTQLAEIRVALKGMEKDFRSDINNVHDRLKTVLAEHDAKDEKRFSEAFTRLDALERVKDQQDGVKGFAGFIVKHGQLLLTIGVGFLAALGLKDKLP